MLVDTLNILWIMDLQEGFNEAITAIARIDFSTTDQGELNVFETAIRYLGSFLSVYDLSRNSVLLRKLEKCYTWHLIHLIKRPSFGGTGLEYTDTPWTLQKNPVLYPYISGRLKT